MKQTLIPETFTPLCSSKKGGLKLNVHLRARGIDARIGSHPEFGQLIQVPPEQREHAQQLRDAYVVQPTDWRDDWAKLKAIGGGSDD